MTGPAPGPGWMLAYLLSSCLGLVTWTEPFDYVYMPVPVAFMAFAGTCAGLILMPPQISRREMYLWVMALTFFAAVTTVVLGEIPHMGWTKKAAPAIAGFLGLFSQALVPAIKDRLRREVKNRGAPDDAKGGAP